MMNPLQQPPSDRSDRPRVMALTIWTVMGLVTAVVASRGMSGAMVRPLPMEWLLLWIAAGHLISAGAGRLLPSSPPDSLRGPIIGCIAALLFSVSLAAVLTPFQWGLAIGVALLHGCFVCEPWWKSRESRVESREEEKTIAPDLALNSQPSTLDSTQWMQRRDDEDGEVCEGHVRVDFAEKAREVTVHVAFCPPLASVPTVELEDVDGLGWELKTAAAYPYGLRITVRRGPRETAAASGHVAYWACARQGTIRAA